MKRLWFGLIMISFIMIDLFGQTPTHDKSYYLTKSKNQQKAGWVLLAGGTAMTVIGVITGNAQTSADDYSIPDASGFLMVGGILVDLISIPLFVSSAKNARTAATLSFGNQPLPNQYLGSGMQFQPSLKLTLTLK